MDLIFRLPHLFSADSNEVEDAAVLCEAVEFLARVDQLYLKHHPKTPPIYKSGIIYDRTVEWVSIPEAIALGYADCKSVTAWRLAELRNQGKKATPVHRWVLRDDGGKNFHILVSFPDGTWEDPSKILGMGKDENAHFGKQRRRRPFTPSRDWIAHFRAVAARENTTAAAA